MKNKINYFLSIFLSIFLTLSAQAEIIGKKWLQDEVIKDEFYLWLGVHVFTFPTYIGSRKNKIYPRPIIEIDKRIKEETPLIIDKAAGIGVKLFDYQHAYIGVTGFWRSGWDAEDELEGLQDRDGGLETSVLIGYNNNNIGFEAMLISSWGWSGDVEGLIVTAKAEQELRLNHLFRPTVGGRVSWANSKYMNNYFGISENEVINASFISRPYQSEGGFRDARLYVNNRFDLYKNIRLYMNSYIGFVLDEAKNSPIVADVGKDINYGVGLGISYRF